MTTENGQSVAPLHPIVMASVPELTLPKPYFEKDGITIYHGDCETLVPFFCLRSDFVCITDPPYGVDFKGEEWDASVPRIAKTLPLVFQKAAIIMGTTAIWQFPEPKWVACWARPASSSRSKVGGFSHWSPILLYGGCKMSVDFKSWHAIANAYGKGFGHPSPKPECVMRWLIGELCDENETAIDPFMGSGTTLVAALIEGRKAIGIEREEKYCELAAKRLAQGVLF